MATLREMRALLLEASRQHSRVGHEAEDLAHDIILAALRRGLPLTGEAFLRSARGSARRHAAFLARSAARRRARELWAAVEQRAASHVDTLDEVADRPPTTTLSPALETTLSLLVLGLDKGELRAVLGVSDAALRKRFEALRRLGPLVRPTMRLSPRTPGLVRLRRSQVDLLARLTGQPHGEVRVGRVLAAGDPDGHGLIFAEVLTTRRVTATPHASPINPETRQEGKSCSTAS